jgi:hypothetical protein
MIIFRVTDMFIFGLAISHSLIYTKFSLVNIVSTSLKQSKEKGPSRSYSGPGPPLH